MEVSPVLFFDGECAFCSFWVSVVLKWEKTPDLMFCSSTSKNLKSFLTDPQIQSLNHTILLQTQGCFVHKSTAALRVLQRFRWFWPLGYLGFAFPLPLRDAVYDFIAKRRHRLFKGKCVLPDTRRFL